jgi:hypothetical protein
VAGAAIFFFFGDVVDIVAAHALEAALRVYVPCVFLDGILVTGIARRSREFLGVRYLRDAGMAIGARHGAVHHALLFLVTAEAFVRLYRLRVCRRWKQHKGHNRSYEGSEREAGHKDCFIVKVVFVKGFRISSLPHFAIELTLEAEQFLGADPS